MHEVENGDDGLMCNNYNNNSIPKCLNYLISVFSIAAGHILISKRAVRHQCAGVCVASFLSNLWKKI
jgi:hypothetical protein